MSHSSETRLTFDLKQLGFEGFLSVGSLNRSMTKVPKEAGVYAIVRDSALAPRFALKNCGGHFKGRDPSVTQAELQAKWIEQASVLYLGKAGGGKSQATLRSRLKQFLDFGKGKPVGHWGGRFIWQLADATEFLVAWKVTPQEPAVEVERTLLKAFAEVHGQEPFANLPPGRRRGAGLSSSPPENESGILSVEEQKRSRVTAEYHRRRYVFAQAMQFMGGAVKSCLDDPHHFILATLPDYVHQLFRCGVWQEAGMHASKAVLEDLCRWIDGMSRPELMTLLQNCGWRLKGDWWEIDSDVRAKFFCENQLQYVTPWEDGQGIDPDNDPLMDMPFEFPARREPPAIADKA